MPHLAEHHPRHAPTVVFAPRQRLVEVFVYDGLRRPHPIPHQNVSTEVHRTGGPFTLVPLPDRDGRPASAVVWMETGPEIARRAPKKPAIVVLFWNCN